MARRPGKSAPRTSRLEWVVAGIGALILFSLVAYLMWYGLSRSGSPPQITVVANRIVESGPAYIVEFTAHNTGGSPASAVSITGEVVRDGVIAATGHALLDFLPENSDRKGGLIFPIDPRDGELVLRAEGYVDP